MALEFLQDFSISLSWMGNVILVILNGIVFVILLKRHRLISQKEKQFNDNLGSILDTTKKEVEAIITTSVTKSKELIHSLTIHTSETQKALDLDLEQLSKRQSIQIQESLSEQLHKYSEFMGKSNEVFKKSTEKMVSDLVLAAEADIKTFIAGLKHSTTEVKAQYEAQLREQFSKALADVEEYRKEQLTLVEKSINRIIIKVSDRILSEAISITEHEKLILESLEKAKKDEILDKFIHF